MEYAIISLGLPSGRSLSRFRLVCISAPPPLHLLMTSSRLQGNLQLSFFLRTSLLSFLPCHRLLGILYPLPLLFPSFLIPHSSLHIHSSRLLLSPRTHSSSWPRRSSYCSISQSTSSSQMDTRRTTRKWMAVVPSPIFPST